jgi:hypothetical protein
MKILLHILAVLYVLIAAFALLVPLPPPPKPNAAAQQAIEDAYNLLGISPDMEESTNDIIIIHRATLKILTMRAEAPENTWHCAWLCARATSAFASISGISLFLLSRKLGR